MEPCPICGRYAELERHHMLHGSQRARAEEDNLVIGICGTCHRNLHDHGTFDRVLQMEAEHQWLKQDPNRTVDDFIRRYGKNYL